MRRIIFTGAGGAGSEAIWRLWHDRYDLLFADAVPESICPDIPHERRLAIPMANDPKFAESVRAICQSRKVDLLIPGVDEELSVLSSMKNKDGWPLILLPDQEFVDLMLDKLACAQAINAAGLMAPKTVTADRANELNFPLIIKPRSGRGSRGVMKLITPPQVAAYLGLYQADPESIIAQELITGQEYTVIVCADNNATLRAIIPVKVDLKRGITIRAETEENQAIVEYAKRFQNAFQPTGVYNIQCVLSDVGDVVPFEINPRVSTTFCLAISTGFDPAQVVFGEGINSNEVFISKEPLQLRRSWKNNISQVI